MLSSLFTDAHISATCSGCETTYVAAVVTSPVIDAPWRKAEDFDSISQQ
jgi:hypothetical protein